MLSLFFKLLLVLSRIQRAECTDPSLPVCFILLLLALFLGSWVTCTLLKPSSHWTESLTLLLTSTQRMSVMFQWECWPASKIKVCELNASLYKTRDFILCAKCLICFPQQGLRKEMSLSSLVSLPPSNIKVWFLLPKSHCVCLCVCSREADSYVLPQ